MDRELTTNLLDCLCAKVRSTPLNSDQAAERSALVSDLGYFMAAVQLSLQRQRAPTLAVGGEAGGGAAVRVGPRYTFANPGIHLSPLLSIPPSA